MNIEQIISYNNEVINIDKIKKYKKRMQNNLAIKSGNIRFERKKNFLTSYMNFLNTIS